MELRIIFMIISTLSGCAARLDAACARGGRSLEAAGARRPHLKNTEEKMGLATQAEMYSVVHAVHGGPHVVHEILGNSFYCKVNR